ncbi:MAG: RidA family protein [Hyphomicrobiales bacterium]|nr:RidA family protein [Hyphomicrobiales bacterium]
MSIIAENLSKLGIVLPEPPTPLASYVGFVRHGDLVFVSGQIPMQDGVITQTGLLGAGVTIEEAAAAARICAINILAQVNIACEGDLERIAQCIKLGGFVASTPDFGDHPKVINGASDFMSEVLGKRGAHARAAIGVAALPMNVSVEVEAIFAIR